MALFGKKKKEEPAELGFGFPAGSKEKENLGTGLPPPPEAKPPEERMEAPRVMPAPTPEVPRAPTPKPIMAPKPITLAAPAIEPKPIIPRTMPEEVMAPRTPEITTLRPHVFLKIDKYKEVMSSIDRISSQLKDLKRGLENLKDLEEKESLKIKDSETILNELDSIAKRFDKIFTNPAK